MTPYGVMGGYDESDALDIVSVLDDIRREPAWRANANREWAYYDCRQLSADVLREMDRMGMLPVVRPLIASAIDAVLGLEAKTKRDFVVLADEDKDSDEAAALSARLHEVERLSRADQAVSDAYGSQVRVGVGWVEVSENWDPYGYWHLCSSVHRREVWWDWRAGPDPDYWRYVVRRRWFDADRLMLMFPGQADLIRHAGRSFPAWSERWAHGSTDSMRDDAEDLFHMGQLVDMERRDGIDEAEWRDTERERLCLYQVWYRRWERQVLLRVPERELVVAFDPSDMRQQAMIEARVAEVQDAVVPVPRLSYWVGPHKLTDDASPFWHREMPLIPFFGMVEDSTNIPYGLIRRMMSMQDEINAGATKAQHLMTSTTVIGDSDAFEDDVTDLEDRLAQKNLVVPLNPNRRNAGQRPEFRVDRELSAQHFARLQEAQRMLPEIAGIYQAMQGKAHQDQSGVAIAALVEQGQVGIAKLNQGYSDARERVGRQLLANEIQRMDAREFGVQIEKNRRPVMVYFNRLDPNTGQVGNDLTLLRTRVVLGDQPQTATYRQQLLAGLLEIAKSIPAEYQIPVVMMIIRGSDYPDREEIAKQIEQLAGLGRDEDPLAILDKQRQNAIRDQGQQLALEGAKAKADESRAKADKLEAEVQQIRIQMDALVRDMQAREAIAGYAAAAQGGTGLVG